MLPLILALCPVITDLETGQTYKSRPKPTCYETVEEAKSDGYFEAQGLLIKNLGFTKEKPVVIDGEDYKKSTSLWYVIKEK